MPNYFLPIKVPFWIKTSMRITWWMTSESWNNIVSWLMAPAPPQRKSVEAMGMDGLLKHLHVAFCLEKDRRGVTERLLPTICVQRDTAKSLSLFKPGFEKTHNVSKLNMQARLSHNQQQSLGSSSNSHILIQSLLLFSSLSMPLKLL